MKTSSQYHAPARSLSPLAAVALIVCLAHGLAGCVSPSRPPLPPVPRTSWQELPVGPIGLVTTSTLPIFRVVYPMSREEAATRIYGKVFGLGGEPYNSGVAGLVYDPFSAVPALIVMSGVATAANAIGGLSGVSEERLISSVRSFLRAEAALDFQAQLLRELQSRLDRQLGRPLVTVPKPLPPLSPAECRRMASLQAGTLAWLPENVTASEYLARLGVETLLEIRLSNPGLRGYLGINPSLSLGADVEVRLIRLRDTQVLARAMASYDSRTHKFAHWVRDEGRALREEFGRCCQKLSQDLSLSLLEAFDGPAPLLPTGNLVHTP